MSGADRFEDDAVVDLFKLQDDVVARLVGGTLLQVELLNAGSPAQPPRSPTEIPDAIDLTAMRGLALLNPTLHESQSSLRSPRLIRAKR